ncbi:MAG: general secretion pathway protein GspL [Burkholderiales bacterium PBB4]|nr:MAG: general secretion pathway protein GspL [Burkholderiales bacterium PBB4]
MSTLIFILPQGLPAPNTSLRAVHTGAGAAESPRSLDTSVGRLTQLPQGECVALVPHSKLAWHRVDLPAGTLDKRFFQEGSSPRLRAVLEGVLEERVLDDTAALHFALAPNAKVGAPLWIAVCDRTWLKAWLTTLEQNGRTVTRVLPEFEPTEAGNATRLYATGEPDRPLLVVCSAAGVVTLPLNATGLQWIPPSGERDTPPAWYAEPAVVGIAEQLADGPLTLQTETERIALQAQSPWDLAQFEFSASRQARSRKRWSSLFDTLWNTPQWRAARWSAIAILLAHAVGLQVWAWKDQAALAEKRAAIGAVLTRTFPEIKVVIDAPVQMARSVAALQRQSGAPSSADMESMLNAFGALAPETVAPTTIEFVGQELRISGLDSQSAELANAAANLQTMGYRAQWEGMTLVLQPVKSGVKP